MIKNVLITALLCLASLANAHADAKPLLAIPPVMTCQALMEAKISLAEAPTSVNSASEQDIDGHKMCVVTGTISPQIKFEVHLPVAGWTQRYLQTGCGGLCGRLGIEAPQRPCTALQNGELAMASTDMGHDSNGGIWGASDLQLRVDFAYRGVHSTALVAKELIKTYYGQAPLYSYFSGCSDGGREAMMEAQRYPEDFDGIAAGAPAFNFLVQNSFYHAWNEHIVQSTSKNPTITEKDLPILHAGALAACDGADGTEDGIISDPTCRFDPSMLVCKNGQTTACISETTANAVAELYRGAHDDDTKLVIGSLIPGSELSWAGVQVAGGKMPGGMKPKAPPSNSQPAPNAAAPADAKPAMDQVAMQPPRGALSPMVASEMIPSLAYITPYDPNWTLQDFAFKAASLEPMRPMHAIFDATNPDLALFHAAGGKLLMWHGLADPHISPMNSIAYAQAVSDTIGKEKAQDTLRLFLIPGMYHCGNGYGMSSVDVLTPLMAWVENGVAADSLMASASVEDAVAGKGRTVFPFPALSVLKAGGKLDNPADWQAGENLKVSDTLYKDWAGADFFQPGFQKSCGFEGLNFVCK